MKLLFLTPVLLLFSAAIVYSQQLPVLSTKPRPAPAVKNTAPVKKKATAHRQVVYDTFVAPESATMNLSGQPYSFEDDFTDNRNEWPLGGDNDYKRTIESGKMTVRGLSDKYSYQTSRFFPVDRSKDFSYSLVCKWVGGIVNKGFGIKFCSDNDNEYLFLIAANGYYKIALVKGGEWADVIPWTTTGYVYQNALPNVLKIVKQGDYMQYFINGNLVQTIPFDGGYGGLFGSKVDCNQSVEFDNLKIEGTHF